MIGMPEILFLLGLFVLIAPGLIVFGIVFRNRAKKRLAARSQQPPNS
jgi:hypothetical protein